MLFKYKLKYCQQTRGGLLAAAMLLGLSLNAGAANEVDISDAPIVTVGGQAAPNIMLLMDTSDSMRWGHMPDTWEKDLAPKPGGGNYPNGTEFLPMGYKSHLCNSLYYNPSQKYAVPNNADGSPMPTPSFTSAPYDGYIAGSRLVNLATEFQAYEDGTRRLGANQADPEQHGYYFKWRQYYTGRTTTPSFNLNPRVCQGLNSNGSIAYVDAYTDNGTAAGSVNLYNDAGNTMVDGYWDRVRIPAAEQQNFAIWYSYYRTRINLAKTAISQAFAVLTEDYRVGFLTVAAKDKTHFLALSEFSDGHRNAWFTKIKGQTTAGSSPTREGLALVGRYYANQWDGINERILKDEKGDVVDEAVDPMTTYCQRNYTILTTDGYWNAQDETAGAVGLDGVTKVGQRDSPMSGPEGHTPRPIFDGSFSGSKKIYDSWNTYDLADCTDTSLGFTLTTSGGGNKTMVGYTKTTKKDIKTSKWTVASFVSYDKTTQQELAHTSLNESGGYYTKDWLVNQQRSYLYTAKIKYEYWSQPYYERHNEEKKYQNVEKVTWLEQDQKGQKATKQVVWKKLAKYILRSGEGSTSVVAWCDNVGDPANCTLDESKKIVAVDQCTMADHHNKIDAQKYTVTCDIGPIEVYPGGGTTCSSGFKEGIGQITCIGSGSDHSGPVLSCNTPAPGVAAGGYVEYGPCVTVPGTITVVKTCTSPRPASWNPTVENGFKTTTCSPQDVTPWTEKNTCQSDNFATSNTATEVYDEASKTWTACKTETVSKGDKSPADAALANTQFVKDDNNGRWYQYGWRFVSSGETTAAQCESYKNIYNGKSTYWFKCTPGAPSAPTVVNPATCPSATADKWCETYTIGSSYVDSCEESGPTLENGWVTTTCTKTTPGIHYGQCAASQGPSPIPADVLTLLNLLENAPGKHISKPVAVCSQSQSPENANYCIHNYCSIARTGPTKVPACTPGTTGDFVTTSCSAPDRRIAAPVKQCGDPASKADYEAEYDCNPSPYAGDADVAYGTCVKEDPTKENNWKTVTCKSISETTYHNQTCIAGSTTDANGVEVTCTVNEKPPTELEDGEICKEGWDPANPGVWISCDTNPESVKHVDVCPSPAPANQVSCTPVKGKKITYRADWTTHQASISGDANLTASTPKLIDSGSVQNLSYDGVCYATHEVPALPSKERTPDDRGRTTLPVATHQNCGPLPCEEVTKATPGGSTDSLADVAQYYYVTDLREDDAKTGKKWPNKVRPTGQGPEDDRITQQHMTTYVIGLGVSGTLKYQDDYLTSATGDFAEIRKGDKTWPVWPDPKLNYAANKELYEDPKSIDDFWHTAVNGRGQYFSASNPDSVREGLGKVFESIEAAMGAGAGIAQSSPGTANTDNVAYAASYYTRKWIGDVVAYKVKSADGKLELIENWSAQAKLEKMVGPSSDTRKIYMAKSDGLVDFTWANLGNLQKYFKEPFVGDAAWSQYKDLSAAQKTAAQGLNLVNYLRGQRQHEGFKSSVATPTKYYRARDKILGDIIHSKVAYVGKPQEQYLEKYHAGFGAFKAGSADRTKMVFAGANDGMLHAFYADPDVENNPDAAKEAWAFVPTAVIPNLYKLANSSYRSKHAYFVDGSPIVASVQNASGVWKTILVGGFNAGGRGYYALDVTDPKVPVLLWEKALSTMGLSFGEPLVSRLPNGKWSVAVTSGYNNDDGKGYMYLLDAFSGEAMHTIATNASAGLSQINSYADKPSPSSNNTSKWFYGGDMDGNVWRFNFATEEGHTVQAYKVATLKDSSDPSGNGQPITTHVEVASVKGKPRLMVGTGRLYGPSDIPDPDSGVAPQVQTVYSFDDPLVSDLGTFDDTLDAYGDLRASLKQLQLAGTRSDGKRTLSCIGSGSGTPEANEKACASSSPGWYLDLPDSGERVNVKMNLVHNTLTFASNVPTPDVCEVGGYGWFTQLEFSSGKAVNIDSSVLHEDAVITAIDNISTENGDISFLTGAGGARDPTPLNFVTPTPQGRRIGWREIVE